MHAMKVSNVPFLNPCGCDAGQFRMHRGLKSYGYVFIFRPVRGDVAAKGNGGQGEQRLGKIGSW